MAVLVTGGAGYIGSHMVLRLADAGEPVVVLDNLTTGFDWSIDHRATFVAGNAGDMDLVARIIAERLAPYAAAAEREAAGLEAAPSRGHVTPSP